VGDAFDTVLIANRGEIAVRIARTLRHMGIRSVAVHSHADRYAAHVDACDVAVSLGADPPAESYLRGDAIIEAARATGAQAIIPGYGFLSENAAFAEACAAAGIVFIGPTPEQIRRFGLKHESRAIAEAAGVPLTPGTGLLGSLDEALAAAQTIGYPVMLKSTAGGGGIGLSRCRGPAELSAAFESVQRLGQNFFSDAGVFLERCLEPARHLEVQIFGDGRGRVVALGERDCSIQRRNQKLVEETPAPNLPPATRDALLAAAVQLGQAVGYVSAGTVEFIYDAARDLFFFLEVNTRLQVEHAITEATTGVDLVEWMIRTAAGDPPDLARFRAEPRGAAIEVRIHAEDPIKNFQPSPGTLTEVSFPQGVRVDGWVAAGTTVSPHYDPLLAKLIVHGHDRGDAISRLRQALAATRLSGIATNVEYLRQLIASDGFARGEVSTRYLDGFAFAPPAIEVLAPGTYTTVQDYPGRVGYWHIGVPPSGPMDDYAFRIANRIVGNHPSAAGLEFTIIGPSLRFHCDAVIALTGAPTDATLDGDRVPFWSPIAVRGGQVLVVGRASAGCRSYLAVRQGFDVPLYLGSKSTFALGEFGGHAGRPLRAGDTLGITDPSLPGATTPPPIGAPRAAVGDLVPDYGRDWTIGVLYGPHGAPDFFTEESIETLFDSAFEVHYNSNRLGVRLAGPKPRWARSDGGEAGLHPSNIHDCEYAIGAINFTGDMPVILTRDGPSLGGFVCPVTIARSELWKVGQVKPGDRIRFQRMNFDDALAAERATDASIDALELQVPHPVRPFEHAVRGDTVSPCVLAELPAEGSRPAVAYRQAGDRYLLVEYGPQRLDLRFRFRAHQLMEALEARPIDGVLELSPGVRSLQIHYDSRVIGQSALLQRLLELEQEQPNVATITVPTRIVRLPMAWQDSATLDAVARYRQSVRDTAPWLPSNVEFMRRINGLHSVDEVRRIVFESSYMVLGLGDVYLGAPCAVPVDPRHRLLTSKYNPARTYTAEGTVGIGGVYMCIYGMDSPGGYQLVGRTLPIWNKFLKNRQFANGEPWLLKFFDQVRYYEVSEPELLRLREEFREGRYQVEIEEASFSLAEYERFLADEAASIDAFRARQKQAFDEEVARWQADVPSSREAAAPSQTPPDEDPDGHVLTADLSGNIWKLHVEVGDAVEAGQPLLIVEAMKMEFTIAAPVSGTVRALRVRPGTLVSAGDALIVIGP
jgi:urea carboxylase